MKQEWIEDFLALVEFGTFSRAALARRVTQSAFSRRIQALEEWLDVQLVDRQRLPVQLTPLAKRYIPEFKVLLHGLNQLRARMRTEQSGSVRLSLATQHSLTISHLPCLLRIMATTPEMKVDFTVISENRDDCVALFMRRQVDLLFCIEEAHDPILRRIPDTIRLQLAKEEIVPISAPDVNGLALHGTDGSEFVKILAFPARSYMGRLMGPSLEQVMRTRSVEIIHESVFLAGVKEMVKAGLGMAWLPFSLVKDDLTSGSLIRLDCPFPSVPTQLSLYHHANSPSQSTIKQIYLALTQHYPDSTSEDSIERLRK